MFLSIVAAYAEERRFYFGADLGVAAVNDVQLDEIDGTGQYTAKLDAGPRLSLSSGYNFYEWFSARVELSVIQNKIQSSGDSYYWQVPFLANFEFRLPNKSRFVPLIGGGPGAVYRNFYRNDVGQFARGHLSEVTFAWQVYGGLRYRISDRCSVGVLYRYPDLPSSGESEFEWNSDLGQTTRVTGTRTQSVSVSFGMKF